MSIKLSDIKYKVGYKDKYSIKCIIVNLQNLRFGHNFLTLASFVDRGQHDPTLLLLFYEAVKRFMEKRVELNLLTNFCDLDRKWWIRNVTEKT